MEFYELNRLYDQSLDCYTLSRALDRLLYSAIPVLISIGCVVSLLSSLVLIHSKFTLTSKYHLVAQSLCNLLFQLVTSAVLITNNYEHSLLEHFRDNVQFYLNAKSMLHFVYNILLYACIWLITIGSLDIAVLSILKLGAVNAFTKVYYKLFVQQLASYNTYFNNFRQTDYTFTNRQHLNPLLGASLSEAEVELGRAPARVSLTSNDLDEAAILELEPTDEISFNYSNYVRNQQAVFCNSKRTIISILAVFVCSVLLGLPQYLAYEVKTHSISVSPSPMPMINNEELQPLINSIYFIQEEVAREPQRKRPVSQNTSVYIYSHNMATAYGLVMRLTERQQQRLGRIRSIYPRFFNITGAYDVAARHYRLCNTLENSDIWRYRRPPRTDHRSVDSQHPTVKPKETEEAIMKKVMLLNLTLTCLTKNHWNGMLTYNTLYFWLKHTMLVSIPICMNVIVLFTMGVTYMKCQQLLGQQTRIAAKRKNINECLESLCQHAQSRHASISAKVKRRGSSRAKSVHIAIDKPEDEVFIDPCATHKEIASHIELETSIHRSQTDQNHLNLLFLSDLALYCSMAFPYTCMRLVLDLFVKDRIKVSLDFFVLYKLALITFHLHLIVKFFLMAFFSVRFRITLAGLFAVEPVLCGVSVSEVHAYAEEAPVECCFSGGKTSSGEYFDANLHTQMASSYEPTTQVSPLENFDLDAGTLDDDNLVKTNV